MAVAWLVDELDELGHAVTRFAERVAMHPVWPQALRLGHRADPMAATAFLLETISERAKEFES
jgi:hypothetical protein